MSYSSPKINKRSAGKGNKTDSPKISKGGKRKGLPITTAPMRVTTRSPTRGRTTVSVTIENRDSDVDGFAITAYLPQSGWKKLKVTFVSYTPHINSILINPKQHDQLNILVTM